jgi:outer membrane protein TolC
MGRKKGRSLYTMSLGWGVGIVLLQSVVAQSNSVTQKSNSNSSPELAPKLTPIPASPSTPNSAPNLTPKSSPNLMPNSVPASTATSPSRSISLTLPEVIQQVLQSNRDLKNAGLDRKLQQQDLKEAESVFNPRFTPSVTVGIGRSFPAIGSQSSSGLPTSSLPTSSLPTSSSSSTSRSASPSSSSTSRVISGGIGRTVTLNDRTVFNSSAQLQAELTTRIGTRLTLTTDPLSSAPFSFTISQPLLRGFGKGVNEAPVKVARLTDTKRELDLRKILIDKISDTINAYRLLYQQQEAVRIQEGSLVNKRYQLQVTTALVKAGRRARADLVDSEQAIADGERRLIEARNQLTLANSVLLRLMDTADGFMIVVRPEDMEVLIQAAIARSQSLELTALLKIAYLNRTDYLQAKLDIETEQLNLVVAQDNQRWGLDLQSSTTLAANNGGSTGTSQTAASLVLFREFGNPRLETETQRRQIGIQRNTNRLNQLTTIIKTELEDQLQTIQFAQRQVVAAQQASELAKRQLEIAQERFKRGGKATIFELTQKEDTLTTARNEELNAKLKILESITQLDRILGTTLNTWTSLSH